MNKKGDVGLSTNTIIIAIVGIIVLLLVVTFFTGGMATVINKIRGVFGGGTAGFDIDLAKANCQAYCERAKLLDTSSQPTSTFCTQGFDIDSDGDGKTTKEYCNDGVNIKINCDVSCTGAVRR